jgi:hypothetical protein
MLLVKISKLYEWSLIISANVLSSLYLWGSQFQHFFDLLASCQATLHTYSLPFFTMCFVFIFFTLHNYNYMVVTWCFVLILLILLNWNHSVMHVKWFFCVFLVLKNYPPLFWILFQFLWLIGLTYPNFYRLFICTHLHPSKVYTRFKNFYHILLPQEFVDS